VSITGSRQGGWRGQTRAWLRFLPGILITLLAFWFLARAVDWGQFLATLASIPLWILGLNVAIYLISMVARALSWHALLQHKVSPGRAVLALNEGYFLNNVLPLRLGELGRAVLLGRRSQLGTFHILSTIVVERSYDIAIAASLLLLVLPQVLRLEWARPVAILLLAVIVAGLVALYLAARYRAWLEGRLAAWSARIHLIRWFLPAVHSLLDGFSVLTRFRYFALSFGLLALSWGLAIFRDWALIQQLAPGAPLWWAALAISAANLGGALPSAAASLGVFEAAAVSALSLVGVSPESGLAYALIVHVTHLISSSLIGAYALSQEGKSLSAIVGELRSTTVKR
jgi:glycosyltransferase 2 family protein